ncbi:MAG: PAS domain S-box protein [Promethearchaeota archaeon]
MITGTKIPEDEQNFSNINIFNLLPDPAFLFKQKPDEIVILEKINESVYTKLGKKFKKCIGKELKQISAFNSNITSIVKRVIETGEPVREEIRQDNISEGNKLGIESTEQIYLTDFVKFGNNGVLMLTKDITKLKQAERDFLESQEFNFGLLAEYAPLGLMVLSQNGTIKYTNPKSTRQLGFSEKKIQNVIGKSVFELPIIETNQEIKDGIQKLLYGEPLVRLEIKNSKGTPLSFFGSPRFAPDGSVNGAVFMYLDSVRLEEMQAALKEREDYNFNLLGEYSPLGIVNLNTEGVITFANPTSTKLFGWTDGQVSLVEGKNILEIPYISKVPEISDKINQLLEGEPLVGLEFPVSFMGKERVLRAYGSPHYNPNGLLNGAILMYADITDLKETQEKLRRQKEELSEFAHQMSHDLTTLIVSILGYSELLNKEYNPIFVKKISKNAKRMQTFLKASLELADAGKVIEKKNNEKLSEIIDEVAEIVIPSSITFQRDDDLPIVFCDREKTAQIFLNLFKNAVIHGKPNEIEVKCIYSEKMRERAATILITNDGTQISVKTRERIFKRGFTTRKNGTGFGFHIIRKLCEAHSWQFDLDPSPKTTFRIFIPQIQPG